MGFLELEESSQLLGGEAKANAILTAEPLIRQMHDMIKHINLERVQEAINSEAIRSKYFPCWIQYKVQFKFCNLCTYTLSAALLCVMYSCHIPFILCVLRHGLTVSMVESDSLTKSNILLCLLIADWTQHGTSLNSWATGKSRIPLLRRKFNLTWLGTHDTYNIENFNFQQSVIKLTGLKSSFCF